MNEKSIISHFTDGTVAYVRSMTIQDRYEGLLEGTRSALSRFEVPKIQERQEVIDSLVERGRPCGEFIFCPELVPEMWGDRYTGECIKEYTVRTRFQVSGGDECLELTVIWDASQEDLLDLGKSLEKVTRMIDFMTYCKHIDWEDLA